MPIPEKKERYTYQDYCGWLDEQRWELIDGKPYNMTPAPSFHHQTIVGNIYSYLNYALKGKNCVPSIAPSDVVLSKDDVVQPDVFVVCDPEKITKENVQGAPDLVIEVLSPSTAKKDRWEKLKLYERFGVVEYILIDPDGQYAERYLQGAGGLFDQREIFDTNQRIPLRSISGLELPLWEVFGEEPPETS